MTDVANTPAPGAGSASGATVTGAPIRLDGVEKRFRGQDQPAVGHLDLDIDVAQPQSGRVARHRAVGHDGLLDEVADHLGMRQRLALCVLGDAAERVHAELGNLHVSHSTGINGLGSESIPVAQTTPCSGGRSSLSVNRPRWWSLYRTGSCSV